MFKTALTLILTMFALQVVNAQHYIGVKGGYVSGGVNVSPARNRESFAGNTQGIVYQYKHANYFAIRLELDRTTKGYTFAEDTLRLTPRESYQLSGYEFPILMQGYYQLGIFRPYATGGLTLGYINGRKSKVGENAEWKDYVYDKHDRKFEYGIAGGLGLGINFSRFEIQGEWRYGFNFSYLRDPIIPSETDPTKNNTIVINPTQSVFSVSLLYRLSNK